MPLNLGSLLRTPSDVAAAARSLLGWTDEAVQVVTDLPGRVSALLDEAEHLVARVGATLDRVDAAVARVDAVVDDTRTLVGRVDGVAGRAADVAEGAAGVVGRVDQVVEQVIPVTGAAEAVLESVGVTSAGAQALVEILTPIAEQGAPLLRQFVDAFSDEEVEALIKLIDQVPLFTEHMETDIMPILATLDRVGPDVHELLDVLKDVRLAIEGVPGLRLLRRRGSEREAEQAAGA